MITLPASGKSRDCLLYGDSDDSGLCYVDPVSPRPPKDGSPGTWHSIPGKSEAFFVGEVAFGFGGAGDRFPPLDERKQRALTMPWEPGNVAAWPLPQQRPTAGSPAPRPFCSGKTSGFGNHNCVLQSKALPSETMRDPVLASAWLECRGRFVGGAVETEAEARTLATALETAAKTRPEITHLPLGYAIVQVLRTLLDQHLVRISIQAQSLSPAALEAARDQVLTEWAHRIVASVGHVDHLVSPWDDFAADQIPSDLVLNFRWETGDVVVLRVQRTHRFPPAPLAEARNKALNSASAEGSLEVVSTGDWSAFDFVNVDLRSGGARKRVTLDRRSTSLSVVLADTDPGKVEVNARGAVSGLGKEVALDSRWSGPGRIEVKLPTIHQVAFLIKADRAWLRTVGPLRIWVGQKNLASLLVPADGVAVLDPTAGDLGKVSAVVRALITSDPLTDPFRFRIDLGDGLEIAWDEVPDNGDVLVSSRQVARLEVLCPTDGIRPVAVEAGARLTGTSTVRSLGEKPIVGNDPSLNWILPSNLEAFAIRSRFEHQGRILVTPWSDGQIPLDRPWALPGARLLPMVVLAVERDVEVELMPEEGELSRPYQVFARAGKPEKLDVICAARAGRVRYRLRGLPAGDWGGWIISGTNLIRITN